MTLIVCVCMCMYLYVSEVPKSLHVCVCMCVYMCMYCMYSMYVLVCCMYCMHPPRQALMPSQQALHTPGGGGNQRAPLRTAMSKLNEPADHPPNEPADHLPSHGRAGLGGPAPRKSGPSCCICPLLIPLYTLFHSRTSSAVCPFSLRETTARFQEACRFARTPVFQGASATAPGVRGQAAPCSTSTRGP
jgi:hypothetical protein